MARLRAADAVLGASDERARVEAEAELARRAAAAAEAERRAAEAEEIAARERAEAEEAARARRERLLEMAESIELDLTGVPEAEWYGAIMARLDEMDTAQAQGVDTTGTPRPADSSNVRGRDSGRS